MPDIAATTAEFDHEQRIAYAHGLLDAYGIANEVLHAAREAEHADLATITDAQQRLIAAWDAEPQRFIDGLVGRVRA